MTPTFVLWLVAIAAAVLLAAVVTVEETRVAEAHREAETWRKRTCHHGASNWGPIDANGDERGR